MYRNFSSPAHPQPNHQPKHQPRFAGHHYHQIDAASRVEGASPHALVSVMFEEALRALDSTQAAVRSMDVRVMRDQRHKALSILLALEASLDFRAGGDLAISLARVYREASRLIRDPNLINNPANLSNARAMIGELAEAWFAIGKPDA
jgi:flagellar secretion chaperone FliS